MINRGFAMIRTPELGWSSMRSNTANGVRWTRRFSCQLARSRTTTQHIAMSGFLTGMRCSWHWVVQNSCDVQNCSCIKVAARPCSFGRGSSWASRLQTGMGGWTALRCSSKIRITVYGMHRVLLPTRSDWQLPTWPKGGDASTQGPLRQALQFSRRSAPGNPEDSGERQEIWWWWMDTRLG